LRNKPVDYRPFRDVPDLDATAQAVRLIRYGYLYPRAAVREWGIGGSEASNYSVTPPMIRD